MGEKPREIEPTLPEQISEDGRENKGKDNEGKDSEQNEHKSKIAKLAQELLETPWPQNIGKLSPNEIRIAKVVLSALTEV
jgi:hypothetical protein